MYIYIHQSSHYTKEKKKTFYQDGKREKRKEKTIHSVNHHRNPMHDREREMIEKKRRQGNESHLCIRKKGGLKRRRRKKKQE
jgi:hypothetical protein